MEQLKHECGVAMIRLLKPLAYYERKYGTWRYGLNKLYLMMEKQHNRGQEGAGVACVNLDAPAGEEYMFRERAEGKDAITEVFKHVDKSFAVCASFPETQQLASKESLSVWQFQYDQHRRGVPFPDGTRTVAPYLWRFVYHPRTDGTPFGS